MGCAIDPSLATALLRAMALSKGCAKPTMTKAEHVSAKAAGAPLLREGGWYDYVVGVNGLGSG